MLLVKALHIIFMVTWFAGLFYLPRLFVYHAMSEDEATRKQLAIMEGKLYRFITPFMWITVGLGVWMLFDYAWVAFSSQYWLILKLILVTILIGYHFLCGKLMRQLAITPDLKSHIYFRWFNEFPVLLLFAIVILAVVKPF
jgi:putative membrane protein